MAEPDPLIRPRFSDISSFFRTPRAQEAGGCDIAILSIPWDGGTTNRPGARHGPQEVRAMSSLVRRVNPGTLISPFELAKVIDLGEVGVNPVDPAVTLDAIERAVRAIVDASAMPLCVGGDHLVTLPILRAVARDGPVGLVHFDAHSDTWDVYFGTSRYTHGTPFRRAVEEGLLDPRRTIQIGIRGTLYSAGDLDFARDNGMVIVTAEEFRALGPKAVIERALATVGDGRTYLSFDIDVLDPAFAPGTGTPEVGGLSTGDAIDLLRLLRGIDWVGADLVEVSPPFDPARITSLAAANLLFEILCLLAERRARPAA